MPAPGRCFTPSRQTAILGKAEVPSRRLQPGQPRRQLEQQRPQRPLRESQQQRPGQQEQQPGLPRSEHGETAAPGAIRVAWADLFTVPAPRPARREPSKRSAAPGRVAAAKVPGRHSAMPEGGTFPVLRCPGTNGGRGERKTSPGSLLRVVVLGSVAFPERERLGSILPKRREKRI